MNITFLSLKLEQHEYTVWWFIMATYEVSIQINAPPNTVFYVVSNWENMLKMERGLERIEYLTEPTQQAGMRGIWHFHQGDRRWHTYEEVTAYDPPRYVAWLTHQEDGKTMRAKGSHTLTPINNNTGTKLVMSETFYADQGKDWAIGMMTHLVEYLKILSEQSDTQ